MKPRIGIYAFTMPADSETVTRKEILIPAGTELMRLYGLVDQDAWTACGRGQASEAHASSAILAP
jgi:hypothetical protein